MERFEEREREMKMSCRKPQQRSHGDLFSTSMRRTILPYGFAMLADRMKVDKRKKCLFCDKYIIFCYGHDKKFCNRKCAGKYKRRHNGKPFVWRGVKRPGL